MGRGGRPRITRPGKGAYNAGERGGEGTGGGREGERGIRGGGGRGGEERGGREGRLNNILPPGAWDEVTPLVLCTSLLIIA